VAGGPLCYRFAVFVPPGLQDGALAGTLANPGRMDGRHPVGVAVRSRIRLPDRRNGGWSG